MTSTEDSLRAELVVSDSSGCTVAEAAGPEGSGRSVARTRGETVTEEAVLNDIEEPPEDAIPLFDDGESTLYRFERDSDGCVCQQPRSQVVRETSSLVITEISDFRTTPRLASGLPF